jgi:hypothetical protein
MSPLLAELFSNSGSGCQALQRSSLPGPEGKGLSTAPCHTAPCGAALAGVSCAMADRGQKITFGEPSVLSRRGGVSHETAPMSHPSHFVEVIAPQPYLTVSRYVSGNWASSHRISGRPRGSGLTRRRTRQGEGRRYYELMARLASTKLPGGYQRSEIAELVSVTVSESGFGMPEPRFYTARTHTGSRAF